MKYIDLFLILLGIFILILSIKPSLKIIRLLEKSKLRNKWKFLTILIFLFIFSYIFIFYFLESTDTYIRDIILSFLLFAGSIFVYTTCYLALSTIKDIQHIQELEEENIKDPLTNLYNRRFFDKNLFKECEKSLRTNSYLSLILIDIDDFKKINDKYGHSKGDEILKQVACEIQELARKTDFVARFGGEEMVVVTPGSEITGAQVLAERMREKISKICLDDGFNITVSIGVSSFSNTKSMCKLIEAADKAMYKAKKAGKNKVELG